MPPFDPSNCSNDFVDCNNNSLSFTQWLNLLLVDNGSGCPAISVSGISGGGGGGGDASAANQATEILKLTSIDNKLPALGVVETPTASVVTASGTVSAGAKSVSFTTDSSFAGTILGQAVLASTTYSYSVSNPNATLAAIAYTRSAGSMRIDVIA